MSKEYFEGRCLYLQHRWHIYTPNFVAFLNVVCLVSCNNSSGSLPPSMWLYWVYLCRGHSKVYAGTNFIAVSQPPRILILDPYSRYISTYCVVIMVNNWHAWPSYNYCLNWQVQRWHWIGFCSKSASACPEHRVNARMQLLLVSGFWSRSFITLRARSGKS